MSEFHDPDLRQQLGRLSGPYPDDNVAFEQWQRRVGQARRRRAVAWTSGAAIFLIVVTVTVAVAASQNPTQHSLVPSNSSESSEELIVTVPTTDVDESSTIESTVPKISAPTTLAPDTTPSSEVEPESSLPETEGTAAAGQPSGAGSTRNHGPSSTSVALPEPRTITQTFTSDGGSITVRLSGEQLTVIATSPTAGFRAIENDHAGPRVEVIFKSGDHQFEMAVRLSDGVMKSSTSERSDAPHEDSAPADTTGSDHSGGGDG